MTTTLTEGAAAHTSTRAPSTDWPFLGAAVAMTAALIALVILDGEPRSAALIVDGPGNGESVRFRRLYLRHDTESQTKPKYRSSARVHQELDISH